MTARRASACVVSIVLTVCVPAPAHAQRVGVGVSVTSVRPSEDGNTSSVRVRPFIRLEPSSGWGLAGALNWFDTDVSGPFAGVDGEIGQVQVKPLMGGIGYTFDAGRLWTTVAVVAGPSYNVLKLNDATRDRLSTGSARVDDSFSSIDLAVRPGVGVTFEIARRFGLTGFAGYIFNRPSFTVETPSGDLEMKRNTDSVVLSAGMVVRVF